MQENRWSCERVEKFVKSSLRKADGASESPEEIFLHLSACDACLDAYLEVGLRYVPEVAVPGGIAPSVLERLAPPSGATLGCQSARIPYFTVAASLLAVVYAFPMIEWKGILAGFDAAARLLAPDSGALVGLHIDANRLLTILLGVVMLEAAAFPICLRRLWQPNF